MNKRLILTTGEPAGIGPDVVLHLAATHAFDDQLVVAADKTLLAERAQQLAIAIELQDWDEQTPIAPHRPGKLWVKHIPLTAPCVCGQLNPANARYVLHTLEYAAHACLQKTFAALITAPVHKGVINEAHIPFTGHTEFLAQLTQTKHVVMMLACEQLRVALVTTHLPLQAVPTAITERLILQTLHIVQHALRTHFHLAQPDIRVCGLNPHAGEGGHLGREEIEVITPALQQARRAGMTVTGPFPADTVFATHRSSGADCIVAMYHDQGLPVLKYASFGHAVNVTLGLPIIRTSVDHGTALDLAGTGKAETGSLLAAVQLAAEMVTD